MNRDDRSESVEVAIGSFIVGLVIVGLAVVWLVCTVAEWAGDHNCAREAAPCPPTLVDVLAAQWRYLVDLSHRIW
jgi:hypothetical protein